MKRAILTGFEPFGEYKFNPVQDLAKEYKVARVGDVEVVGLVLPCTYYGASEVLFEKVNQLSPDIILSTGLASRIPRLRLETIGRNVMDSKYPDADGRKPKGDPIMLCGDLFYLTNADNIGLANKLYENEILTDISVNADAFICNSLIYLTAKRIKEKNLPIKHTFLHTPWTSDYLDKIELEKGKVTVHRDDLRKTVEILLQEMNLE